MLGSLISKIAGRKETPTQVFSYAYCEFCNNVYFQKHLRTAVSDYSFIIVIYSFSVVYTVSQFLSLISLKFFSCAARVSCEYLPLGTFAFIINDVFEKNNRDKGV